MKTEIKNKFLKDFTFKVLFDQFIDPSIRKKSNTLAVIALVALIVFILIANFYCFSDYGWVILILPILFYISFQKAIQIKTIGVSKVLTDEYKDEGGISDDTEAGMQNVKIRKMQKVLKGFDAHNSPAIVELQKQYNIEAKAGRSTVFEDNPLSISFTFTLSAFFIGLIVGGNKPSMENMKMIASLLFMTMTASIFIYYFLKTFWNDLLNSKSKKLEELSALLGEVNLELLKTTILLNKETHPNCL
ncbi:MAG TPA: hypothetical protein VGB63_18660 [Pedobacter sp.]|jgi:hypothetical protein